MRKTKEVRITSGTPETNRDHGKVYELVEMSAYDAERWAADAFTGLVRAGVEVPDDLASAGIVAIATMGLRAIGGIPKDELHDLLDRMMNQVIYFPDPERREICRGKALRLHGASPLGPLMTDDIEELSTRLLLRQELLQLHGGFLMAGVQSLAGQRATAPN